MGAKSFNRLPVAERRAQLLEVGARIFNERSYAEVSVDDIAQAAGVSTSLLYHYFSNKHVFYLAVVELEAGKLLDLVRGVAAQPLAERFEAGINAYVDFVAQASGGFLNLLRDASVHPDVAQAIEDARQAISAEMLDALGVEERPALRLALQGFQGLAERATLDWLRNRDLDREVFKALLTACSRKLLAAAADLDPELELEEHLPRG
jgi:AcrR family transcriptional regulator